MIIRLLEKHGELTVEQISQVTGVPKEAVEVEIQRLWGEGKVCMDKHGKCYIPPKTTFSTWLFVAFLLFVISWTFVGAIKATF